MNSRYTIEPQSGFLLMRIAGAYNYWDFIQYPHIIRKLCEETGNFKVLVDVVAVTYSEIPTLELFFMGEKLAEVLRDRVKIAIIWHGDPASHFLEKVAVNRAASIRVFDSSEPAASWLLYDLEDEPFNFLKT